MMASHGSTSSAGIGVLVSERFLCKFEPIIGNKLTEIIPGRVGGLQLTGPEGCLDIWCVYLTPGGARAERTQQVRALISGMRPATQALTAVGGDWNFAAETYDRGSLDAMTFAANTSTAERKEFLEIAGGLV